MRCAVIGVGYLGAFHAEKYARSKKAELVGVLDLDKRRAKKIARKLKTQVLEDLADLPDLGVQCASVACDTTAHYSVAKYLLENGIDVLLEKPMTTNIPEARELIDIAHSNQRILQVGHLERFNPAFTAMKQTLTQPWFFEVRRISPFSGRGHDVDVVLDLMIHDIDIVAHLVGRPLARVEAVGIPVLTSSVDIANARLTFDGGAVANITASRAAFKSERTIRVFQPDLYISLDFGKKKMKMYTKAGEKDGGGFPKIEINEQKVLERDALADQIDSFLEAVLNRSRPVVGGEDGVRALELAERIREAFKESFMSLDNPDHLLKRVGNFL